MVEVVLTDEALAWFESLDDDEKTAVSHLIDVLEMNGVGLASAAPSDGRR